VIPALYPQPPTHWARCDTAWKTNFGRENSTLHPTRDAKRRELPRNPELEELDLASSSRAAAAPLPRSSLPTECHAVQQYESPKKTIRREEEATIRMADDRVSACGRKRLILRRVTPGLNLESGTSPRDNETLRLDSRIRNGKTPQTGYLSGEENSIRFLFPVSFVVASLEDELMAKAVVWPSSDRTSLSLP